MLCIATEQNQKRVNGKIRFFNVGDTFEFDECPPNFTPIDNPPTVEDGAVDYATMGETWLRQYDGNKDDLAMFILSTYKDAVIPPNATWNELVNLLQAYRETCILLVDNTGKKENKLASIEQTEDSIIVDIEPQATPEVKVAESKPQESTKKSKKTGAAPAPSTPSETPSPELSKEVEDDLNDLFKES